MDYVTHISHQMQKHKFDVICPSVLLRKPHREHPSFKIVRRCFVPQSQPKALLDPQIPLDEKHKFSVTCPDALFMETTLGPPEHEK
jgi:hypothetical protein